MKDYTFIQENPNFGKILTLILSVFLLSVILILSIFFSKFFYDLLYSIPYLSGGFGLVAQSIKNATLFGLFYAHIIGGIFFIPSPDEIIFYYGLLKGNNYFFAIIFAVSGYMIAQVLNYYVGRKISPLIMHIVSKKKVYKARRTIHKYGTFGIFLFNFLPLPGPLLTFSLGIARYNFTRLFIVTLIGKVCKYLFLIMIFMVISA